MTIKYLGSKARFAKEILSLILVDRGERHYVEPFVGSASVIINVEGGQRMGADRNHHIIAMHKALQDGWEPPIAVTLEEYQAIKRNPSAYPKHLVAFVGIGCSFGAKWFGGYARDQKGKSSEQPHARQSHDSIMRSAPLLQGIEFVCSDYRDLQLPNQPCIIYCDPPYANSTGYQTSHNPFSSWNFWRWCDRRVAEGHRVFVSEYAAPDGWMCVWERACTVNFDDNRDGAASKEVVEKLFMKRET